MLLVKELLGLKFQQSKQLLCVNFKRQPAFLSPFNWFLRLLWRNSISLQLGSYDNRGVVPFGFLLQGHGKEKLKQNRSEIIDLRCGV